MTSFVKKIELHDSVMRCFFFSARDPCGVGSTKRSSIYLIRFSAGYPKS
jgi:hypothetical protein